MKTITQTIDLYSYDELSERAKENVRQWLGQEPFDYSERLDSLKAFCDRFGVVLRDYCIGDDRGAFIKTDATPAHFRGIKLKSIDREALPTGVCYDCGLMHEFYDVFKKTGDAHYAFRQALEEFLASVRREVEYTYSDEHTREMCEANGYTFTESGEYFQE